MDLVFWIRRHVVVSAARDDSATVMDWIASFYSVSNLSLSKTRTRRGKTGN
jgi:hypothetical protein